MIQQLAVQRQPMQPEIDPDLLGLDHCPSGYFPRIRVFEQRLVSSGCVAHDPVLLTLLSAARPGTAFGATAFFCDSLLHRPQHLPARIHADKEEACDTTSM